MDLDTYPYMHKLVENISHHRDNDECEDYLGSPVDYLQCGSWGFCPPKDCSFPMDDDFMKYRHADCWSYMRGALYILSRNLAEMASAPGTWWSDHISGHEDLQTGKGVTEHARSANMCVRTWNPHGWDHLR
eukprot:CAMPEP_0168407168 /NCGR_PEP_ID=MMETSP0228-20121227/26024_1 /TAXON_ID=133427 /ORGANISM="Protoceratium reticulatum, Strain CCCM 535 (=CCMP 1889)" /LENGTH=130 /DNA_ID=CAMNT_0008420831 /DNA_START=1 /DNA_END=390 /DNA_ORIENTATION=+